MLVQLGEHVTMAQTKGNDEHTMLVETVCGNFEGFTKNEVLRAKQARWAQAMMGNPSEKDYKGVVSNHLISNCPITVTDITNSCAIHGPALASVRGKTVRRAPGPVVTDYVDVPRSNGDTGCRRLLCGWHGFSDDNVETDQIHYIGICAGADG